MSEAFQTVNVLDDRLNCKSTAKFAVEKGGSSVTVSENMANSASPSSQIFNIIVPSEQVLVDRRLEWSSIIKFRLQFSNLPAGTYDLCNYGHDSALVAYPLHSLVTTMTGTINNNTVSVNMDDVLPLLSRMLDREHTAKYTNTTPTCLDNYLNFADGVDAVNNPLGSYSNTEKSNDYHSRGAFPLLNISTTGYGGANNTVVTSLANGTATLYVTVKVTEPFMLSPFIFAHDKVNSQAVYGIQNLNIRMNLNPNAIIWNQSQGLTNGATPTPALVPVPSVQVDSFEDAKMTLVYLSAHPENAMPTRNVVSFMNISRYISKSQQINVGQSLTLNSNQIQLNTIPDKLGFALKRKVRTCADSVAFIPIEKVSINWNNHSGILSSCNQEKLWLMGVEAGCNSSWLQYSGGARVYKSAVDAGTPVSPYPAIVTPLCGSPLVLDFAKHIEIVESYFAPGSLGQFALQVQITAKNNTDAVITADDYDLIIYTIESGIWVTQSGVCQQFLGILTKADVLQASGQPTYYRSDVDRVVGAGLMDGLKSTVGSAMGQGASGGGASGGGESGGRRH